MVPGCSEGSGMTTTNNKWQRNMLARRPGQGQYHNLFHELQDGNIFTFNYYNSGQQLLMYCSCIEHIQK